MKKTFVLLSLIVLTALSIEAKPKKRVPIQADPAYYTEEVKILDSLVRDRFPGVHIGGRITLTRIAKAQRGQYDFYFNRTLSEFPLLEGDARWVENSFRKLIGRKAKVRNIYGGEDLLPTLETAPLGSNGLPTSSRPPYTEADRTQALVQSEFTRQYVTKGLNGRNIALWGSHGWYHSDKTDEWVWQRPYFFGTVEDLLTQGMVMDYLTPMLENAGACVLMPRERGTQNNVVNIEAAEQMISIEVEVPEPGVYPVYITYHQPSDTAKELKVQICSDAFANDGVADTKYVNPNMGFDMPVYIGEVMAEKSISIRPDRAGVISSVRVGSGYGRSGLPRYCEGARYYLEDFGADSSLFMGTRFYVGKSPVDTLKWDEYTDDYMSRGKWTQNLSYGSRINPERELVPGKKDRHLLGGKRIPVDLSLALHSDAGKAKDSTYIGTLAIYTLKCDDSTRFPNGEDRALCREVCNTIQTQVVEDLRSNYDTAFVRRGIWNRSYSESRTTSTSAILLEGFSHQSFPDMVLANDPKAKFTYCRAIYKGMLKYMSNHYGCPYAVTPLGVRDIKVEIDLAGIDSLSANFGAVISWEDEIDPLEPTARAEQYLIYGCEGSEGYRMIGSTKAKSFKAENIGRGAVHSFKVVAVNQGGRSFASEAVSVGIPAVRNDSTLAYIFRPDSVVTVVNNFTRIAPAAYFAEENRAGFDFDTDSGVPFIRDVAYVGKQYDFDRNSPVESNVYSGHGASFGGNAGNPVAGNTLDYTLAHAAGALKAGYAVQSSSLGAFLSDTTSTWTTDIICGKQAKTALNLNNRQDYLYETLPAALRKRIESCGKVMLSGCYIGSDAYGEMYPIQVDSTAKAESIAYLRDSLGVKRVISRGTDSFKVKNNQLSPLGPQAASLYREKGPEHYSLERTDAFIPAAGAKVLLQYEDSRLPAAILFKNKITFAFPLECITSQAAFESIYSESLKQLK